MIPKSITVIPELEGKIYWDQTFIVDLLDGLPDSDRKVFLIPGAYQADCVDKINAVINKYPKVLIFITSDEEGNFPINNLRHPDMYILSQYGTSESMIPLGYTPQTRSQLKRIGDVPKFEPWFFSGQINHSRRKMLEDTLSGKGSFYKTEGFSRGMEPWEYFTCMASAIAVPCPPGNVTQDSFRVYEALESGCVPVVDLISAQGNTDYWQRLFGEFPFLSYSKADEILPAFDKAQDPALRNKVFAWWISYKMSLRRFLKKMLDINEAMTIIVPTSPIKSHPSTDIIDQTIRSIRKHTSMDIIITIDGVRKEQEYLRNDYTEYIRKLLWKCNFEYENVQPLLFDKHVHQSGMMKKALEYVGTPLVMYVEHDTPLVTDEDIDWGYICKTILSGDANVVRFHYEAKIPEEHEYLMVHSKDMPFYTATKQWSQRPHIARTDFYRHIMQFFSDKSNCFIEDRLYGKCVQGDFDAWKVFIYTPPGNIKRSLNLDGRGGDIKFETQQIW